MARRTFFSFHYQPDVWRAWNVRNSWVVKKDEQLDQGFFDGSVFEASKRESDDSLKRFLREELENISVTCVLAGTNTWARRWVRYEIARSIVKGNGLLTIYIDGVKNDKGETSIRGADPLAQMGVYRATNGIFLAEWNVSNGLAIATTHSLFLKEVCGLILRRLLVLYNFRRIAYLMTFQSRMDAARLVVGLKSLLRLQENRLIVLLIFLRLKFSSKFRNSAEIPDL